MGLENGVKEMTVNPVLPEKTEQLYGGIAATNRRITTRDLIAAKARGDRWPMITTYDALTAQLFDDAGIPVLLVGDSARRARGRALRGARRVGRSRRRSVCRRLQRHRLVPCRRAARHETWH